MGKNRERNEFEKELMEKSERIKTLNSDLISIKAKYKTLSEDTKKYINLSIVAKTEKQKLRESMDAKEMELQQKNEEYNKLKNVMAKTKGIYEKLKAENMKL